MPIFVDEFDLPLSSHPYIGTVPRPVEMGPVATAPQDRRVRPQRDDNMIWRIVGKISLAVDWWTSQGRIHCDPADAGHVHIRPGVLNFCDGIRSLIQIQQSFEISAPECLAPG